MSARAHILQRIREAAGRDTPSPEATAQAYRDTVATSAPRPAWQTARQERFLERLEAAAATWHQVDGLDAVPGAVAGYCEANALPLALNAAPHPGLEGLSWPADWTIQRGLDGLERARVTLTVARFGIAETGTLMVPGGAAAPPSMNLLAEHHLVVLDAAHLVDYQEQAWAGLRAEQALPRAVMLITGPSRTADIEQTLQLGAHGPRKLHLILVGAPEG